MRRILHKHAVTCHCKLAIACAVVASCSFAAAAADAPPGHRSKLVQEALAYEHGEGVRKDGRKAAALYCEAARQFDAEAIYNLGWMYANGRGIPREDGHAAALFAFAANLGYEHGHEALRLIGGVPRQMPSCVLTPEPPPPITPAAFAAIELLPFGPDPFANLPAWKKEIAAVVEKLAPRYGIDTRLALAVIAVESNFDRDALSDKGAAGLMQLIPATAARFNVARSFDVNDNLRGGLTYLRWLLAYYEGRVTLAAAAYNAGEAAVDRHGGIPPYAETREYVRRVVRLYGSEKHPYDATASDPSPALRLQR